MEYATDGDLNQFSDEDLELSANWFGPDGKLVSELVSCGFINPDRTIHNWEHYGGRILQSREASLEKQARYRQRKAAGEVVTVTSPSSYPLEKSREEKKELTTLTPKKPRREPKEIPDDWMPDETGIKTALKWGMPEFAIADQVQAMKYNYQTRGKLTASPAASWATWCQNYLTFRPAVNGNRSTSTADEFAKVDPSKIY